MANDDKLMRDPEKNKEKFKQQIVEHTQDRVPGADEQEVEEMVDERYEELLDGASVKEHIPTLVTGDALSEFQKKEGLKPTTEKEMYLQQKQAELDKWQSEVDELKAKSSGTSGDEQLKLNEQVGELEAKIATGEAHITKVADASEGEWKSLKQKK